MEGMQWQFQFDAKVYQILIKQSHCCWGFLLPDHLPWVSKDEEKNLVYSYFFCPNVLGTIYVITVSFNIAQTKLQ